MKMQNKYPILILCALALLAFSACKDKKKTKTTVQTVTVEKAISKTIPVYYDFVGNTQSIQSVDITARVEGYLTERNFKDGQNVNKGDLLFVIDPRTYKASLDEAKAQLEKDRAALNYSLEQVARYEPLVKKQYITTDEFDQYVTQSDEALAAVKADEAQVIQANYGFTNSKVQSSQQPMQRTPSAAQQQEMDEAVGYFAQNAPNSFEYHYFTYTSGNYDVTRIENLRAAEEIMPDNSDVHAQLAAYNIITRDRELKL